MVNAEKHKKLLAEKNAETDDIKPIKSTIAVDFKENDSDVDYFVLGNRYGVAIKEYIANNFKKEITDLDVMNFSLMLSYVIIATDNDKEKAALLKDITEVLNDEYKKNEYIFTHLAIIKSWNETAAELNYNTDISESKFMKLMDKNVERNQYIAWNDERKILDMYSGKGGDVDGRNN